MRRFDGDLAIFYISPVCRFTRGIAPYKHGGAGGVWFVRVASCVMPLKYSIRPQGGVSAAQQSCYIYHSRSHAASREKYRCLNVTNFVCPMLVLILLGYRWPNHKSDSLNISSIEVCAATAHIFTAAITASITPAVYSMKRRFVPHLRPGSLTPVRRFFTNEHNLYCCVLLRGTPKASMPTSTLSIIYWRP